MDTTVLELACRASGMLESAIPDGVRRLEGHFAAQADPTPELIARQLTALRETARHLFPQQASVSEAGVPVGVPESVWKGMAPSARLAWLREHGYALKPEARRAKPLVLSAEQAAALAQLPAVQRLAAYRQLQAQQQG